LAVAGPPAARAFPPSPHHTLYGLVRDEQGEPLTGEDVVLVLETATGVQLRAPLRPGREPGVNYRLQVPMDAGLTPDNYRPTALRPRVSFQMKVLIHGVAWLPLETRGNYARLGRPAESTRLDLTLGEDSDGDGLPDAWERALIAMLDGHPGLADIRPGDDSDGDGMSNLSEYLAGTYAFDPGDGFELKLLASDGEAARLQFTALRGHTYTIEGSEDLRQWRPVEFRLPDANPEDPPLSRYYAPDVRPLRVTVTPADRTFRFFRLQVR
jgi:hypothetical protein